MVTVRRMIRVVLPSYLLEAWRRTRLALRVLVGATDAYPRSRWAHHVIGFSQEGEDGILLRLFERQQIGTYVDVGAHHPQRFSNTYRLYLRGWSGINIDPSPGTKARFDAVRPRDVTLEVAVSDHGDVVPYMRFDEAALNTCEPDRASTQTAPVVDMTVVPARRLSDILDAHLGVGRMIDVLSVDVEGHELPVLRSNDWERYRPRIVLVELAGVRGIDAVMRSDLHRFLIATDYELFGKTVNTLLYQDRRRDGVRDA